MSLNTYLIDTKVNLMRIMDIHVKSQPIKPLEKHKGEYFHGWGGGELLGTESNNHKKIDKIDFIKN